VDCFCPMVIIIRNFQDKKSKPSLWRRFRQWWTRRQTTLLGCCISALLITLINTVGAIYLHSRSRREIGYLDDHFFFGNCKTASRLSSLLHAIINILSTGILGCSNLCLQLLLAPTRGEVNKAHRNMDWLDIGVPSTRNFRKVPFSRRAVWLLLTLTSIPLHLL
jgi:hypothetical protein